MYTKTRRTKIISIAGGKGGVGKTLISSNLSLALASFGGRVLAVDCDIYGPNLHTHLANRDSLEKIFTQDNKYLTREIKDFIMPGKNENLDIISGPSMKSFLEKNRLKKFLKQLRKNTDYDFILLDIGAGNSDIFCKLYNCADFKTVVATPEPSSIENLSMFIKTSFVNSFAAKSNNPDYKMKIHRIFNNYRQFANAPYQLIKKLGLEYPLLAKLIEQELENAEFSLIVNQVHFQEDERLIKKLKDVYAHFFGINIIPLAVIESDPTIRSSARMQAPHIKAFPQSRFSLSIQSIARKMSEDHFKLNVKRDVFTKRETFRQSL